VGMAQQGDWVEYECPDRCAENLMRVIEVFPQ